MDEERQSLLDQMELFILNFGAEPFNELAAEALKLAGEGDPLEGDFDDGDDDEEDDDEEED